MFVWWPRRVPSATTVLMHALSNVHATILCDVPSTRSLCLRGKTFNHRGLPASLQVCTRTFASESGTRIRSGSRGWESTRFTYASVTAPCRASRLPAAAADSSSCTEPLPAAALTEHIMHARTLPELSAILSVHEGNLNPIHISAMFTKARRLQPHLDEVGSLHALLTHLTALSGPQLHTFGPRQLANTLYSAAKLRLQLAPAWLLHWQQCALQRLPAFDSQALSNSLWAFATYGYRPSDPFISTHLDRTLSQLPAMSPQDIANVMWAVDRLQIPLPTTLAAAVGRQALLLGPRLQPRDHAHLLHTLGRQPHRPPEEWLNAVAEVVGSRLNQGSVQDICMLLHAFGALAYTPSRRWLRQLAHAWRMHLSSTTAEELSSFLAAAATLPTALPAGLITVTAARATGCLPHAAHLATCTSTLSSLHQLSEPLPPNFVPNLLATTRRLIPSAPPEDLAPLLHTLTLHRIQPPPAWTAALTARTQPLLTLLPPQHLSSLLNSFSKLGRPLSPSWTAATIDALHPQLPSCTPRTLSTTLHALAALRHPPPDPWLSALWSALTPHLLTCQPVHLTLLLWAHATLETPLPPHLHAPLLDAALRILPAFSPRNLSLLMWAAARLALPLGPPFMTPCLQHSQALLPRHTPQDITNTLWALARLGHTPPPAWLHSFTAASLDALPSYNPQQLANCIWALAALNSPPSYLWAKAFLLASHQLLPAYDTTLLLTTLCSMSRLGLRPPPAWVASLEASLLPRILRLPPADAIHAASVAVYNLSRLGGRLSPAALQQLLQLTEACLPAMTMPALSHFLYGISRADPLPPAAARPAFRAAVEQRLTHLLPDADAKGLSRAMDGLARLRHTPGSLLGCLLLAASKALLPCCAPGQMAAILASLVTFRLKPDADWGAHVLPHVKKLLPALACGDLLAVACSLPRLHAAPPESWVKALLFAVGLKLRSFETLQLAQLLLHVPALQPRPSELWATRVLAEVEARLPCADFAALVTFTVALTSSPLEPVGAPLAVSSLARLHPQIHAQLQPAQVPMLLKAVSRCDPAVGEALLPDLFTASTPLLKQLAPHQLADCAWSIGSIAAAPTAGWMAAYLEACGRQMAQFQPPELAKTTWAVARLAPQLDVKQLRQFVCALQLVDSAAWAVDGRGQSQAVVTWAASQLDLQLQRKGEMRRVNEIVVYRGTSLAIFSAQGQQREPQQLAAAG